MKPGTKASFLLGVIVCAILGVVFAVTQLIVLRSFIDLEDGHVRRNTLRAVSALEENAATLGNDAADWAIWDDSYAFVQDRNQQYIDSNLPNSTFNYAPVVRGSCPERGFTG